MKALLLVFSLCISLHAGDLTLIFADAQNKGHQVSQISLYRLFDPIEAISALQSDVGQDRVVFRNLPAGAYSVVYWSKNSGWSPSPDFDKSFIMESGNMIVDVRLLKKEKLRQVIMSFPKIAFGELGKFWDADEFVPCRIQRIEGIIAPSFGFRWVMLKKTGKNTLEGKMPLIPGNYIFTIPYPTGAETYPPPKSRPNRLSQPLFAFPISVTLNGQISCVFDGIDITFDDIEQ